MSRVEEHLSNEQKQVCVIPVAADDALLWAAGKLHDKDLLTKSPLVPEAVFVVNLPDRASYRQMLTLCKYWRACGAVFMIARTGTPVVENHMETKNGCIRVFQEAGEPVKYRFVVPPDRFTRWLAKWSRRERERLATGKPDPIKTPIL